MNKRQLRVFWIAIGLIVLIGVVPPWTESSSSWAGSFGGWFQGRIARSAVGYRPVFLPPDGAQVDIARLFI